MQPEVERISGIICSPSALDFSVCILFFLPVIGKNEVLKGIFAINVMAKSERHSEFFVRRGSNACKQLTSLIVPRVSCLRPWERQNFPEPLKLEQTLSHR